MLRTFSEARSAMNQTSPSNSTSWVAIGLLTRRAVGPMLVSIASRVLLDQVVDLLLLVLLAVGHLGLPRSTYGCVDAPVPVRARRLMPLWTTISAAGDGRW